MTSSSPGWEAFAKYPVNADIPQGYILDSATFLLNILMSFLVILPVMLPSVLILLYILIVTRHLICGKL